MTSEDKGMGQEWLDLSQKQWQGKNEENPVQSTETFKWVGVKNRPSWACLQGKNSRFALQKCSIVNIAQQYNTAMLHLLLLSRVGRQANSF